MQPLRQIFSNSRTSVLILLTSSIMLHFSVSGQNNKTSLDSSLYGTATFSRIDSIGNFRSDFKIYQSKQKTILPLKDVTTLVVSLAAFCISLITLLKGIREYKKAQKWKKAEFVSKEIKEFYSNINVSRALKMLDWNIVPIEITESEKITLSQFFKKPGEFIFFTDKLFLKALRLQNELPKGKFFSGEETIIRLVLDDFLSRLGMFNQYIKNNLVTSQDIHVYLSYVIDLICNEDGIRKPKEVTEKLKKYISAYDGKEVAELCQRFGYDWPT